MDTGDVPRDRFMLKGPLAAHGYDWWWHNFTAYKRSSGEARAFFIEYFVCNPALGGEAPVLGQLEENRRSERKPSYALVKAGFWGPGAQQIHGFYGIKDFSFDPKVLDIKIGPNELTEHRLKGSCALSKAEAEAHPEYMSGFGTMSWDLKVEKKIAYNVGYGASPPLRALNAFQMFWHAEGIKTEYSGEVVLNGEAYDVIPERSYGYADKNWGVDFTSPWLWISSCNLKSLLTGRELGNSAVEFGGGNPAIYGISLGRKLLGCLVYEGRRYEFNFSKFWTLSSTSFTFEEGPEVHTWTLEGRSPRARLELVLHCRKDEMLLMNYEAPSGQKRHTRLWNGGTGYGEIKLYEKRAGDFHLLDHISMDNTGCEYGEYGK